MLISLVQQLFGPDLWQKGKNVPLHALKARMGCRDIGPVILGFVINRCQWSRRLLPLYTPERTPVPIDYDAGWPPAPVCAVSEKR